MRIIAGRWRGHTITAPPGEKTRPTTDRVRESWMSVLQHGIDGATVLDLFAGSGALGLEMLSRGAAHVTFVEKAAAPLRVLQANIDRLGAAGEVEVVKGDALKYVDALEPFAFDIALADPPYDAGGAPRLMEAYARRPFARILCIEHRAGDALPQEGAVEVETRRYGQTALTFITAPEE
ncbi:MAG TPA: 16S rRNA (guanine(966)-N(2))-methyltransferase RsmD [Longimicrobiales bacterium]|nr:16S rRNA (guanine(966)-N(2))-methyltransferase RsmD [Longimicrobiales bacterium]